MIQIKIELRCDHTKGCVQRADHESTLRARLGWAGQVEVEIVPTEPLPPGWVVSRDLCFCEDHVPSWVAA